jgi:hypothetical protein
VGTAWAGQGIADDVNKKVEKRLADFEAFKTLIETSHAGKAKAPICASISAATIAFV